VLFGFLEELDGPSDTKLSGGGHLVIRSLVTSAYESVPNLSFVVSSLIKANLIVLGLLVLHTVDHAVGQEARALPGSSSLVGAAGFAITAGSAWLAIRRSPIAPQVSTIVGALTAAGVLAIHILPSWWGWVSDPYWDFDTSFISWLSLIALLASALYLTAVGLRDQRLGHATPSPAAD